MADPMSKVNVGEQPPAIVWQPLSGSQPADRSLLVGHLLIWSASAGVKEAIGAESKVNGGLTLYKPDGTMLNLAEWSWFAKLEK